jgi:hypothetical protein
MSTTLTTPEQGLRDLVMRSLLGIRLNGFVRAWNEREAERAAWTAAGVSAVDNRIAVIP